MLKFRRNELVDFEHYLQVRQPTAIKKTRKGFYSGGLTLACSATVLSVLAHLSVEPSVVVAATVPIFGFLFLREPKAYPTTPDQQLRLQADASAETFHRLLRGRKLRGSLHSAMASLLNECAQSWRRILAVNQSRVWRESERASYWNVSQQDWTRAADLAMAEALVLGEASVTFKGPRSRAEVVIEEVFGALSIIGDDHLPPQFSELREIAGSLQTLANEVESISRTMRDEAKSPSVPTASRRLEDVLGQMRSIRTAEDELHHYTSG